MTEISNNFQLHNVTIEMLVSMTTEQELNQCCLLTGISISRLCSFVGPAGIANLHLRGDEIEEGASLPSETLRDTQGQARKDFVKKTIVTQRSLDHQFSKEQQETMKKNRIPTPKNYVRASDSVCAPECIYLKTRVMTAKEIRKRFKKIKEYKQFFRGRVCYMFLTQDEMGSNKGQAGTWRKINPPIGKAYLKNSVGNEKFVALDREEKLFAACGNVQSKEYVWNFGVKVNGDGTLEIDPSVRYDSGT